MIIQAVNSYNYIPSKNLSINKVYNGNQLLYGFERYKLQTPTAGITELVTWIERTIGDISLTMDYDLTSIGGIVPFLFKKIVVKPLQKQKAIESLNKTIQRPEISTNKQLEIQDKGIDILKIKITRHEDQIKTFFGKRESV